MAGIDLCGRGEKPSGTFSCRSNISARPLFFADETKKGTPPIMEKKTNVTHQFSSCAVIIRFRKGITVQIGRGCNSACHDHTEHYPICDFFTFSTWPGNDGQVQYLSAPSSRYQWAGYCLLYSLQKLTGRWKLQYA